MKAMVDEAEKILVDETCDLDDFGRLLHESWMLKRSTGILEAGRGCRAVSALPGSSGRAPCRVQGQRPCWGLGAKPLSER